MSYNNDRHYRSRTHNDLITDPKYMPSKVQTMKMNVHEMNYLINRKIVKAKQNKIKEKQSKEIPNYYGSVNKSMGDVAALEYSRNKELIQRMR